MSLEIPNNGNRSKGLTDQKTAYCSRAVYCSQQFPRLAWHHSCSLTTPSNMFFVTLTANGDETLPLWPQLQKTELLLNLEPSSPLHVRRCEAHYNPTKHLMQPLPIKLVGARTTLAVVQKIYTETRILFAVSALIDREIRHMLSAIRAPDLTMLPST